MPNVTVNPINTINVKINQNVPQVVTGATTFVGSSDVQPQIDAIRNTAQYASDTANTANSQVGVAFTSSQLAFNAANNATSNIAYLSGVDVQQNTNISLSTNLAQNAFNTANTKLNQSGGSISGNLSVTGIVSTSNIASPVLYLNNASVSTNTITTSVNTPNQVLDITNIGIYRSVKYLVQVSSGTDYQTSEILLIHDGSNAYITEYGTIYTNTSLMTYDADISSSNARLLMTPTNNINTVKVYKISNIL